MKQSTFIKILFSGTISTLICSPISAESLSFECRTGELVEIETFSEKLSGIIYVDSDHSDIRILSCKILNNTSNLKNASIFCETNYEAWNDDFKFKEDIYLEFTSNSEYALLIYTHLSFNNERETVECNVRSYSSSTMFKF